jgi:long-chain acyl-CoA synthetase
MLQVSEWMKPILDEGKEVALTPLPLYHIFSLTVNCLTLINYGAASILITNPKDMPSFLKTMKKYKFTLMTGVNTLFNGLLNQPEFHKLDFSNLKVSVAGGMALQTSVAEKWQKVTQSKIIEGYGLTETSPVTCCNPIDNIKTGSIGMPFPSTDIKIIDDNGEEVGLGERGELCIKGPQVMKGYWQQEEETKNVLDTNGWLKTGDIAVYDEDGYFKIVDRKKDMILVSGFNVFPNEVEDAIALHPKVDEVAAIGIPDEKSGEVVKVFITTKDKSLDEEEIKAFCKENLAGYKCPKVIEFREELPKSNVGKILRRMLKED